MLFRLPYIDFLDLGIASGACADGVYSRCDYPLTCHHNLSLNPGLSSPARDSAVNMSSPDRPRFSQADFLARWMPSSARAGVILSPCPDLAGTLRHASAVGSEAPGPDASFVSDFAPLVGSVDSSCLDVDGGTRLPGGERSAADRPVNDQSSEPRTISDGELESLDEMESNSQEVPLMMKLEQVMIKFILQSFCCLVFPSAISEKKTKLHLSSEIDGTHFYLRSS